jgi:NAD(P)-dependent dehydrogenase (short-subunit alcohol dehydrogenase family)
VLLCGSFYDGSKPSHTDQEGYMDSQPKTILITGATNGIGKSTALQLAGQGYRVVIAGRSQAKCIAAAEEIQRQTGQAACWMLADLSSQAQVRSLAAEFCARFDRLDVLINNAGAVYIRRAETVDRLEMGWAVNYFSHFLLTNLLLDALKASSPARVINLSSVFHWFGRIQLNNITERGPYIGWNVYARTKLACLTFTYELARRLVGTGVTANAIHPGLVVTGMGKTSGQLLRTIFSVVDRFAVTAEEGARGVVNLAINPALAGVTGRYFNSLREAKSSPVSRDLKTSRRLWEISEKVTNLTCGG